MEWSNLFSAESAVYHEVAAAALKAGFYSEHRVRIILFNGKAQYFTARVNKLHGVKVADQQIWLQPEPLEMQISRVGGDYEVALFGSGGEFSHVSGGYNVTLAHENTSVFYLI